MFELGRRYSDGFRDVIAHANEEAHALGHDVIGTEHMLLGLVREHKGLAFLVLRNLGVDISRARSIVESLSSRSDNPADVTMNLHPEAQRVLRLSVDEADRLHHPVIGTEHLLLALVGEGLSNQDNQESGMAALVLESIGLHLEQVRNEVLRAMGIGVADSQDS